MDLLIYCAGGLGSEVMDLARRINLRSSRWEHLCFIDDVRSAPFFYGVEVYPFDRVLDIFPMGSFEVVIANGEPAVREKLYGKLREHRIPLATLIDPSAIVSDSAQIGSGVALFGFTVVSSRVLLSDNSIFYPHTFVGHDCRIQAHCVVAAGVNIGGHCTIGQSSFIGMGATIRQNTAVGRHVIIGMNAAVTKQIPNDVVAYGVPAQHRRMNSSRKVF